MRCDVLAIGTELLLGQVVDTNSAWIGEQLAAAGIDCYHQVKVGDNQPRIVGAIRNALARSDAVICCGGLGPTQDDVTREAIAEVLGVPLELDEEIGAKIESLFTSRGRRMSVNNLRQAEVPRGATVIPQTQGTAPGLVCRLGDRTVYAVPGVPHEMRDMVARAVIPDLVALSGARATIASRTLRTWGLTESGLAEIVAPRLEELDLRQSAQPDGAVLSVPTIAFLASGIEGIKVRLTVKAGSEAAAESALSEEEAEVRKLVGPAVFGVDDETMEAAVGRLLVEEGLSLGVAESLTGGLVGSRLTSVPGSSQWFRGSIVAYATEAKRKLLGVGDSPAVSEDTARDMAAGAAAALGADIGLSLTGVAGPTEQDGEPVGTVWVAVYDSRAGSPGRGGGPSGGSMTRRLQLPGDREYVRQLATISTLDLLRRHLMGGGDA